MEASQITVSGKTYDINHLGKAKRTMLRRKLIVEFIMSKPAGELIKMGQFQEVARFNSAPNADAFIKRMIRDGVIMQHKGDKPRTFFYSVVGVARQIKPPTPKAEAAPEPAPQNSPSADLSAFILEMQQLGVKFTITLTNEENK